MQGKVKWFSHDKGFGFITSEDGVDHYFNVQSTKGDTLPSTGDTVQFDAKPGHKGMRANNVEILAEAPAPTSRPGDDRIACPDCKRKIVPRLVTYNGKPQRSLCPYCGATVKNFGCFIATAVYQDPWCSELNTLRHFRDTRLLTHPAGRLFVRCYYRVSPPIASWLQTRPGIAGVVKKALDGMVRRIEQRR